MQRPEAHPWDPPRDLTTEEGRRLWSRRCELVRKIARGEASETEQQLFFEDLVHVLSGTYDLSFRPEALGGDRATTFAEGKRWVGLQLVTMLKTDPVSLREGGPSEDGS